MLIHSICFSAGPLDIATPAEYSGVANPDDIIGVTGLAGGSPTYSYAGFQNTSGVPDSPTGSWVNYGSAGDTAYAWYWQATEAGTIDAIQFRGGDNSPSTTGGYVAVYNGTTLVGYGAITSSVTNAWSGYITVNVESGQSLDFSTNDDIYISIVQDGGAVNSLERDNGNSTNANRYYTSGSWTGTPPTSITFLTSGSTYGLGVILRYE